LRAGFGIQVLVEEFRARLHNLDGLPGGHIFQKTGADHAFSHIRANAAYTIRLHHSLIPVL
jgi:hypothetical protein